MIPARAIDATMLLLYVAALFAFGFYFYFRNRTLTDYFEGGRQWKAWLVALAVASTNIGAANTVGAVALAYREGYSALWYVTLQALAFVPFAYLLVPRVYPLEQRTLAEYLEQRYSRWLRPVAALALGLATFAILPAQIVGGASVVSTLTGWAPTTTYYVVGIALILYTSLGGLPSVVYTDTLQWSLLVLGFAVGVPLLVLKAGGLSALLDRVPESHASLWTGASGEWGFLTIAAWAITVLVARFGSQEWFQRARAAQSAAQATRGFVAGGLMAAPFGVLTMLIGVSALTLLPGLDRPDQAFAESMLLGVPTGLRALVMGAILAAVMSSGESSVNAASALFVNDVWKPYLAPGRTDRHYLRVSQLATAALGVGALGLAVLSPAIVDYIRLGFLIRTPVAIVVLFGLFSRRPTSTGAAWSIVSGTAAVLSWRWLDQPGGLDPFWVAAPISVLTLLVVSSAGRRAVPAVSRGEAVS